MSAGKVVAVSVGSALGGILLLGLGAVVAFLLTESEYGATGYADGEDQGDHGGDGMYP